LRNFLFFKKAENVFKPKLVFLLSPKTCIQLFFLLLPTLIQQILLFRCCQKYIGECVYYERLNQCFSYKKEPGKGGRSNRGSPRTLLEVPPGSTSNAKQSKAKQSKAKQSQVKLSKAKLSKIKQS